MASSFSLGAHFESFVQGQLAGGRYNNASEVLRDALRLMEDRDAKLQALRATLNASIRAGGAHTAFSAAPPSTRATISAFRRGRSLR